MDPSAMKLMPNNVCGFTSGEAFVKMCKVFVGGDDYVDGDKVLHTVTGRVVVIQIGHYDRTDDRTQFWVGKILDLLHVVFPTFAVVLLVPAAYKPSMDHGAPCRSEEGAEAEVRRMEHVVSELLAAANERRGFVQVLCLSQLCATSSADLKALLQAKQEEHLSPVPFTEDLIMRCIMPNVNKVVKAMMIDKVHAGIDTQKDLSSSTKKRYSDIAESIVWYGMLTFEDLLKETFQAGDAVKHLVERFVALELKNADATKIGTAINKVKSIFNHSTQKSTQMVKTSADAIRTLIRDTKEDEESGICEADDIDAAHGVCYKPTSPASKPADRSNPKPGDHFYVVLDDNQLTLMEVLNVHDDRVKIVRPGTASWNLWVGIDELHNIEDGPTGPPSEPQKTRETQGAQAVQAAQGGEGAGQEDQFVDEEEEAEEIIDVQEDQVKNIKEMNNLTNVYSEVAEKINAARKNIKLLESNILEDEKNEARLKDEIESLRAKLVLHEASLVSVQTQKNGTNARLRKAKRTWAAFQKWQVEIHDDIKRMASQLA